MSLKTPRVEKTSFAENKAKKKQSRYIDSDEEDDDLDDFIDDGEDDIDYSAAIRDIFGYDKSRFVYIVMNLFTYSYVNRAC